MEGECSKLSLGPEFKMRRAILALGGQLASPSREKLRRPVENLVAPASGPGHFHQVTNKGKCFPAPPWCWMDTIEHQLLILQQETALLPLGSSHSPNPPTGAQVTLSLLRCSLVPMPGTKTGSPLLLQIHFKLSSPSSPEK